MWGFIILNFHCITDTLKRVIHWQCSYHQNFNLQSVNLLFALEEIKVLFNSSENIPLILLKRGLFLINIGLYVLSLHQIDPLIWWAYHKVAVLLWTNCIIVKQTTVSFHTFSTKIMPPIRSPATMTTSYSVYIKGEILVINFRK